MEEFNNMYGAVETIGKEIIQKLVELGQHELVNSVRLLLDNAWNINNDLKKEQRTNSTLQEQIKEAGMKLENSLRLSVVDNAAMAKLKEKQEEAWLTIDSSQLREQKFQQEIAELLLKITELELKLSKLETANQLYSDIGPLADKKETIIRERDRLQVDVEELQRRLKMQRVYSEELEKKRLDIDTLNHRLTKELDSVEVITHNLEHTNDSLQKGIDNIKIEKNILSRNFESLKEEHTVSQKEIISKETEIQSLKLVHDQLKAKESAWTKNYLRKTSELSAALKDNQKLNEQIKDLKSQLKSKDMELSEMENVCKRAVGNFDSISSKLATVTKLKNTLNQEVIKLRNQISSLEKEGLDLTKIINKDATVKGIIIHERNTLKSNLIKSSNEINELKRKITLQCQTITNLENDLYKLNLKIDEQNRITIIHERERNRSLEEIQSLKDKIEQLQDDIQLKNEQLNEMKCEADEQQSKYIKLSQLFENVTSEQMECKRSLLHCNHDKDSITKQLDFTADQVIKLQEQFDKDEKIIINLNSDINKLNKVKRDLQIENHNTQTKLQDKKTKIKAMYTEIEKFNMILDNNEKQMKKQNLALDNASKEKTLITTQLIKANDENELLKEKLSILQTGLDRGQLQYNQRIDDIRLLKIEITNLISQRNVLSRGLTNTADMRHEVLQLHRNLNNERIENRALREEVSRPINIHKWRILEIKEPDRFQLLKKIKVLQQRILNQKVNSINRETDLQNCHRLYLSLKSFMEKLPSYKVKEDLNKSQAIIRKHNNKMKSLVAELNVQELEIKTKDCSIEELKKSLVSVKKDLISSKKTNIQLIEKERLQNELKPATNNKLHTLGAGFKIPC